MHAGQCPPAISLPIYRLRLRKCLFLHARCFISAETFCASYDATCDGNGGRFDSTAECVAVYNSLAAGDAGATSGASQACLECESVLYPSSVPPMTRYPP